MSDDVERVFTMTTLYYESSLAGLKKTRFLDIRDFQMRFELFSVQPLSLHTHLEVLIFGLRLLVHCSLHVAGLSGSSHMRSTFLRFY